MPDVATLDELPSGEDVLRVTTFNILAPVWTHSSIYPGMDMSKFDPPKRRQQQAEVLRKLDSDIVFLQECQKTELDALLELDGGKLQQVYDVEFCPFPLTFWTNWLTDATDYQPRENGVCVLTKRAVLTKLSAEHLPIDLPEWEQTLPKYALGAHACLVNVEVSRWGGARALIATSHLDADSAFRAGLQGTALAGKLREKRGTSAQASPASQGGTLTKLLGPQHGDGTLIWGGDFNMEYRASAVSKLLRAGDLQMASGALRTPTVFAVPATVRVDHVLCDRGLRCEGTFVPRCPLGHTFPVLPLLSELQWLVCTLKGERGCCLRVIFSILCLVLFPFLLLVFCPVLIVGFCERRKQCARLSWALEEWGSDHLPATVALRRAEGKSNAGAV